MGAGKTTKLGLQSFYLWRWAMYPVIKHIISPTRYQSRDAAEMVTASGKATFNRVKYPVMTASRMPIPPGANTNKTPMVQAKGKQKIVEKCRG